MQLSNTVTIATRWKSYLIRTSFIRALDPLERVGGLWRRNIDLLFTYVNWFKIKFRSIIFWEVCEVTCKLANFPCRPFMLSRCLTPVTFWSTWSSTPLSYKLGSVCHFLGHGLGTLNHFKVLLSIIFVSVFPSLLTTAVGGNIHFGNPPSVSLHYSRLWESYLPFYHQNDQK